MHDQVFVDEVLQKMISDKDLEKVDVVIVESDICKGQYKSADYY